MVAGGGLLMMVAGDRGDRWPVVAGGWCGTVVGGGRWWPVD